MSPGPDRREPPCPHFAQCGGCDLQHIDDAPQLALKVAAVRETLERVGKLTIPADISIVAGKPWGYRLRTQLHTGETPRGLRVGYFARGSHTLVPVDRCPVLVPELEALLPTLPKALGAVPKKRLDLALGDDDWTCAPPVEGLPKGPVSTTVGAFSYRFDARCFFQGNRTLLERLVEVVVGPWEGEAAYDLYAGVGLFSLPLARCYGRVTTVESDSIAVRYAKQNVRANDVANVEIESRSTEAWIPELPPKVARVVVDPPRSGLPLAVRHQLVEQRPERLTYVSCHPAALARDLRALERAYAIESLVLLDLFPQTGHMEVVAQLVARGPAEKSAEVENPEETVVPETVSAVDEIETPKPEPAEPEALEPEALEPEVPESESDPTVVVEADGSDAGSDGSETDSSAADATQEPSS